MKRLFAQVWAGFGKTNGVYTWVSLRRALSLPPGLQGQGEGLILEPGKGAV